MVALWWTHGRFPISRRYDTGVTVTQTLADAIATVPAGRWAVGVSGGADSVALLSLLRRRSDLSLHVVHLDHQTRGAASTEDAEFVRRLAAEWRLECTVALREQIEPELKSLPANPSARYRALRMELFRRVVGCQGLQGVILAHHADDQAETVLHRLVRGSGASGLSGMSGRTYLGALQILRPLLGVRREMLRDYLREIGQEWREDASNVSDAYLRNRLRRWLAGEPELHEPLIALAEACRKLRDWTGRTAPQLQDEFAVGQLSGLPCLLARESTRRWLIGRGSPPDELAESVLDRLIEMAGDAASPVRRHFPGGILIRRQAGKIRSEAHAPPADNQQPTTRN